MKLTSLLLGLGFTAVASAQQWPTDGWPEVSTQQAITNGAKFEELEKFAFPAEIDEQSKKGIRTNGLVVIKDGKLVYERYGRGFDKSKPHLSWSMAKSVVNALYGRAVMQGLVDIEQPIAVKSSWVKGKGVEKVRYKDALAMASGIRWSETYEYAPVYSSVVAMLYTRGKENMPQFVANQGLEFEPGTHWEYSSGDTNLLSGALKDIVGEKAYQDYPWTQLFDVLGMKSSVWEQDQAGNFIGSSYWYATPRDMAKFGYLYLQDGVWEGQRLLPEGWVNYSCKLNQAYIDTYKRDQTMRDQPYGAQFWLNAEDKANGIEKNWPDVPNDACAAQGHWRQIIAIIPSKNMVVVRVADDRSGSGKVTNNKIVGLSIAAFADNTMAQGE